ncbi:hypothetical protein [Elizabethkingia sp. YR214]|uniref:hypothetical protein n=1 Tax=Elizabethkingia sp. YR214 TaxID=2135667 RepID=UPI001304F902|nr:hypothetical protein [Elizabethkingia sp. YR214]
MRKITKTELKQINGGSGTGCIRMFCPVCNDGNGPTSICLPRGTDPYPICCPNG